MSTRYPQYPERAGCFHHNYIDDAHEGMRICCDCALVLEENRPYLPSNPQKELLNQESKNEDYIWQLANSSCLPLTKTNYYDTLLDIAEIWNLPKSEVKQIYRDFVYKKNHIKQTSSLNYKDKQIFAYCLYKHVNDFNYKYTAYDVAYIIQEEKKKHYLQFLTQIQSDLDETLNPPIRHFAEKIYSSLPLTYSEKEKIIDICTEIRKNHSRLHPKTLCLIVILEILHFIKPEINYIAIIKQANSNLRYIRSIRNREKKLKTDIQNIVSLYFNKK